MHRYEELEKLYYKRKYKQFFTIVFPFIFVAIVVVVYFFVKDDSQKIVQKQNTEPVITKNVVKQTENIMNGENNRNRIEEELNKTNPKKVLVQKKVKTIKDKKNKTSIIPEVKKLVLYPIFPDVDMLEKNKTNVETKKSNEPITNTKVTSKTVQTDKKLLKKEIKQELNKSNKQPQIKITTEPKNNLNIVVTTEKAGIQNWINSYNVSPSYKIAIKIANYFYNKKKYQKSIEWAKKANKIEPEKSESWYIFSKSLIELGNESKAKKVLIAYLNTYGADKKIEELLRSLK